MSSPHHNTFPTLEEMMKRLPQVKKGKVLTLHLPDTLPAVERALVEEIMDGLMEYVHGEDISNLQHAKVALGVLYHYVYETQNAPATHDGSGEVMGHGRCVV